MLDTRGIVGLGWIGTMCMVEFRGSWIGCHNGTAGLPTKRSKKYQDCSLSYFLCVVSNPHFLSPIFVLREQKAPRFN